MVLQAKWIYLAFSMKKTKGTDQKILEHLEEQKYEMTGISITNVDYKNGFVKNCS